MATDYALMVSNLLSFHDFRGQTLLAVGAGGGQLVGYAGSPRKVIAIENDPIALAKLREAADANGFAGKFDYLRGDFMQMELPRGGDVTLFEFCLHEMADPVAALRRAGQVTREVIVFDHGRTSEWAYYTAEEDKVRMSWEAVAKFNVTLHREYATEQKFASHSELLAKTAGQGDLAVQRAERFRGQTNITIPMTYELALIDFASEASVRG